MKRVRNNYKKAVEVAKDVIKWLDARKIKVLASNGYVVARSVLEGTDYNFLSGESLQKVLPKLKKCEVCALGACFIAHVDKNNEFNIPEDWGGYLDRSHMEEQLGDTFTHAQMEAIEQAFEAAQYDLDFYGEEPTAAEAFGIKYSNHTKRLRAIMNNIIENNGVFKP